MPEQTMHCFLSPKALALPSLSAPLRALGKRVAGTQGVAAFAAPVVVAFASELARGTARLPDWSRDGTTRYLIVVDVPEALLPRVLSALDLRRPDLRLHQTRDEGVVRRFLVCSARRVPMLGIVDAYLWDETLTVVTGDLQFMKFPVGRVPVVSALADPERGKFEVDPDGSYLHWPAGDIRLGVSQILQDADPMYLADVEIERYAQDHTGASLRRMREERGLRQADIPGLSERQVRRVEEGVSRLRAPAAGKFAAAFAMDLRTFLDEIARRAGEIRRDAQPADREVSSADAGTAVV